MIRRATLEDFATIVVGGQCFWATTPYEAKGIAYNPEAVTNLLTELDNNHYLTVATEGGVITGFLGLWIAPMLFNPDYTQATELFFFVHPAHRGKGIGRDLHAQAETELSDEVDMISFGDLSTSNDLDQYYISRGFTQTERAYTRVL